MAQTLKFADLVPPGVRDELEQLTSTQNADWAQQHDEDGSHTAVTLDSLTTRDTSRNLLPIRGSLNLLMGGLYLDEEGNSSHVSGLRPTQWTADQHDYNPPGLRDALIVEVESDASRSLTGISVFGRRKRFLAFGNRGNQTITVRNNHAGSQAVHRFGLEGGSDHDVDPGGYRWFWYDVGSNLWRIFR